MKALESYRSWRHQVGDPKQQVRPGWWNYVLNWLWTRENAAVQSPYLRDPERMDRIILNPVKAAAVELPSWRIARVVSLVAADNKTCQIPRHQPTIAQSHRGSVRCCRSTFWGSISRNRRYLKSRKRHKTAKLVNRCHHVSPMLSKSPCFHSGMELVELLNVVPSWLCADESCYRFSCDHTGWWQRRPPKLSIIRIRTAKRFGTSFKMQAAKPQQRCW